MASRQRSPATTASTGGGGGLAESEPWQDLYWVKRAMKKEKKHHHHTGGSKGRFVHSPGLSRKHSVSHPDLLDISSTDPEVGADSSSPAPVGKPTIKCATVIRSVTAPNSPEPMRADAPHQPSVMRAALGARRQGSSALHAPEAHRARAHSFRMHTLFYDAQVNNLEECMELLAKGENVNQAKGVAQLRPLHVAATCGSFEVASQLLNAGAEKDVQDTHGLTPLMLAFKWRRSNYADLAALLLAAGANGEIKDSSGRTALFYAAINKDRRGVQLLAQSKVQGALEVAAALDFDDILTECLGAQTAAGLHVR